MYLPIALKKKGTWHANCKDKKVRLTLKEQLFFLWQKRKGKNRKFLHNSSCILQPEVREAEAAGPLTPNLSRSPLFCRANYVTLAFFYLIISILPPLLLPSLAMDTVAGGEGRHRDRGQQSRHRDFIFSWLKLCPVISMPFSLCRSDFIKSHPYNYSSKNSAPLLHFVK